MAYIKLGYRGVGVFADCRGRIGKGVPFVPDGRREF